MRPRIPSAIALSILCCLVSACDDADVAVATSPSAFRNELNIVGVVPSTVGQVRCPSVSPFSFPFILNVTAGTRPLTLAEVRIQPTNPFGRTSPPTVFDSSSLTRQFGSVTVGSFGVRQFPFTHNLTCDMSGSVLDVAVTTTDGSGMNRVSTMQVPIY